MSGRTQLVGLLGWPVAHSLSPAMHNAAAQSLDLDLIYVPLPVAPTDVAAAVHGLAALGFLGANVTIPHKEAVLPHLDEASATARALGAVNTIVVRRMEKETVLHGYNTDVAGFLADLAAHGVKISGRDCLLLGAGGAARAAAYGLARAGGEVHVFARRHSQATDLVAALRRSTREAALAAHQWPELPLLSARMDAPLIVNATPVGMHPDTKISPWTDSLPFPAGSFVYDMVYNPRETIFMQQARASGCRAANGLGMLLHQGARAFELWTGKEPSLDVMARALENESPSP